MNIFNKVTLQTLKRNRTRTVVTIIGVILAAAMLTAVTTLVASLQSYMLATTKVREGDWHGAAFDLPVAQLTALQQHPDISAASYMQAIGYAQLAASQNKHKPYLHVVGFTDSLYDTLPVHLAAGKLPQTSTELLLPVHLAYNGGVKYKIGDTLTLALGQRMLAADELGQFNSYMEEEDGESEKLVIQQQRTYTVVGIYQRPSFEPHTAPGYTAITQADAELSPNYSYHCYWKMKKPAAIYTFLDTVCDGLASQANNTLLLYLGVSHYDNFLRVLHSLAAIFIALIMFGAISLIYNAFAISVSERSKQFAMLASVGATKEQLRRSIYFEALFVSAIGIPLGVLSGLLGIGITLHYVGHLFDAATMNAGIPFSLQISLPAIGIAAVIALATVLISASIPARRINKLSPIAAIRQTRDIAIHPKQVRTSRLTGKLFGLPGTLARKNFKRQRGKHRSTIISLTLSIVLFISAAAFNAELKASTGVVFSPSNVDIAYIDLENDTPQPDLDRTYQLLASVPEVSASLRYETLWARIKVPEALLNKQPGEDFLRQRGDLLDNGDYDTQCISCFLPDSLFREFAREAGEDPDRYFQADKPQAIAYDTIAGLDYEQQKYITSRLLNQHQPMQLNLQLGPEATLPVQIATYTQRIPTGTDRTFGNGLVLIMPEYQSATAFAEHDKRTCMSFQAENHAAAYAAMQNRLLAESLSVSGLTDVAAAEATDRNFLIIVNVFTYGFIVLISLIAIANVFNTVYTNIQLRRQEFAMLKSVGMTPRGFSKMMHYECGMYAVQAVMCGLPLSYFITYLIYRSITQGVSASFTLPWLSSLVAIVSTFAIVFATNAYALRGVRRANIVDALRNENL